MAFHVACPITCRRICFCPLGFPRSLATANAKGCFLEEVLKVQEFLKDPSGIRARDDGRTVQVVVPRVSPPPPPPPQPIPPSVVGDAVVPVDDESAAAASAQAKRAALQRKAAADMVAAEDFARRFESGDLSDTSRGVVGEEQGQSNVMCRICFCGENEGSERARRMLPCKTCGKKYHRNCLKTWAQHRDLFHWSSWACPSCRICEVCRRTGDPNKLMFCKRCDGAYHCYCQHPSHKNVTAGVYVCPKHTKCHSCGSNVPGNGLSVRWFLGYTCCDACGRLFVKGNYCPVCLKIGLVIGNIGFIRSKLPEASKKILHNIVDAGMVFYMFVLGLEMDPYVLFKVPTKDAKVAYAGMVFTFVLACGITPFLHYTTGFKVDFTLSLSMVLSSTASPVLTRMITSLKIGKSDIGQLVIATGMHSDFITTLFLSIGYVIWPIEAEDKKHSFSRSMEMGIALLVQTLFTAYVSPIFMNWINNENPEGKPMKGSHLVLSMAFMAFAVSCSAFWGYSAILSAFMAGIFLPREGRVSKWVIGKINYILSTIFYPIFFFWMGYEAAFSEFRPLDWMTWARLFVIFAIATIGKVAGTVISGAMLGFHWPESVALGLLLTTKGHFHIYLAIAAKSYGKTSTSTSTVMVIAIFFTVVHAPSVVAQIIKRARRRAPTHRMSLQLLDPLSELRILLCLHGPQNISTTINFIEICRGTPDPGIMIYVTDMIELTDQIAATLVKEEGKNTMTVTDKAVTDMRDQVTAVVQAYVEEHGDGITIKRLLALSNFNGMPQDICILAEDSMVAIIILPFHKTQRADGTLDAGHSGFRYVNRKVLRNAPCTVGILVDRGLGLIEKISRSYDHSTNVAVIFIGGKDDREALAYAGFVARHPGVKLTVIRFLVDTTLDASSRPRNYQVSRALQEEEMKLDDECFAKFYERHVACGQVAYMEKHLANSSETYTTLRALDGLYSLIIVGRGERVNTDLTFGMNDWQQCPELGPIGDVLSGSDFSIETSVLIIQQNSVKGELDGLDDDFSVM